MRSSTMSPPTSLLTIRSARIISWIWKRIVSRFSNTSVTNSPTWMRRRFFNSMMRGRNTERSNS